MHLCPYKLSLYLVGSWWGCSEAMLCSSLQTCHCCFETSDPPAASCGNATTRRYLAAWTLAIGAGEFLLNPTVGKLSDAIGRKPFMLLSVTADNLLSTARKKNSYPPVNALERAGGMLHERPLQTALPPSVPC